ncbi:MAG TPA: hypothetical protein PKH95_01130 [Candidatus Magasanikbacteria bacterium]|nr:hypothetical protein [Candidatus Magasanikbacteria bacterium]
MEDQKKPEAILEEKDQQLAEPVTLEKINELLTNNLKWSQIIYEQNRKINKKLFWTAFANYLKLALIIVPLVVGLFYLLPGLNNFLRTLDVFSGYDVCKEEGKQQEAFWENLLNQLPIDHVKQEQIKALLR